MRRIWIGIFAHAPSLHLSPGQNRCLSLFPDIRRRRMGLGMGTDDLGYMYTTRPRRKMLMRILGDGMGILTVNEHVIFVCLV
jgi:hypothetical protein